MTRLLQKQIARIWENEQLLQEFHVKVVLPMLAQGWMIDEVAAGGDAKKMEDDIYNEYYEDWAMDSLISNLTAGVGL